MTIDVRSFLLALLICLSAFGPVQAQESEPQAERSLVLEGFDIPTDGDLLLAPVAIAGRTYRFMVDTGSFCTVFDSSLKSLLGRPLETRIVDTPSGSSITQLYPFPQMLLGRMPVSANNTVACFELDDMEKVAGVKIDGFIGSDVLSQYVVRLDFDRGRLSFL